MNGLLKRKIAWILVVIMLSLEVATPVFAQEQGTSVGVENTQNTNDSTGGTDGSADQTNNTTQTNMTQEELNAQMAQAAQNVEKALGKNNISLDATYYSEDGSSVVAEVTDPDGNKNVLFDTDEELIYDESQPKTLNGFTYVGTGANSGVSIYRESMTFEELEDDSDGFNEEYEESMSEIELVRKWADEPTLVDPGYESYLEQAISEADAFSEQVKNERFVYIASPSTASGSEASQKATTNNGNEEEKNVEETDPIFTTSYIENDVSKSDTSNSSSTNSKSYKAAKEPEYGWVMVNPPDEVVTNDILFSEAEVYDCDPEGGLDSGTKKTADVLIVDKDSVYFQLWAPPLDGGEEVGLNGVAVTISYWDEEDKDIRTETAVTKTYNGHAGYAKFTNLTGVHSLFINLARPGYKTQTYFSTVAYGGNLYSYLLEPVENGEIYLRAAAIDGVDIAFSEYNLSLLQECGTPYEFKYLVSMGGNNDPAKISDEVYMRTVPVRPKDWASGSEIAYRVYRDKVFHPSKKTGIEGYDGSKQFIIESYWSEKTDEAKVASYDFPKDVPEGGDDKSKVRFFPGDTVYLDLPNGATWSETGKSWIKLNLNIDNAVVDPKDFKLATWNLFGMPVGTGSGGGITFDSKVPGLKNANLNCSLLDFTLMAAIIPDGAGIVGYKAPGPIAGIIKDMNAKATTFTIPRNIQKGRSMLEQAQSNADRFCQNADKLMKSVYSDKRSERRKMRGMGNLMGGFTPFVVGMFSWSKALGRFTADVNFGVTFWGYGSITGYIFAGPLPLFLGVEGTPSLTVSATVGLTFRKGQSPILSDNMNVTGAFNIMLSAYFGAGLKGVLGAEVKGGGNIDVTATKTITPDLKPFIVTAGWNLGYRVYLMFFTWSADFLNNTRQLYPKLKSTYDEDDQSDEVIDLTGGETSFSVTMDEPVAEGYAIVSQTANGTDTMEFIPYNPSAFDAAAEEKLGDTQTSSTQLMASDISNTHTLQYIPLGQSAGYGGIIARIAYVKCECSDGVERVLPKVVVTKQKLDGSDMVHEIVGSTEGTALDGKVKLADWEKSFTYGYDYNFTIAKGSTDKTFSIAIVSGPDNEQELEDAAVKALGEGASEEKVRKAILTTRMKYQHVRMVSWSYESEYMRYFNGYVLPKAGDLQADGTYNYTYAYTGSPAILDAGGEERPNPWNPSGHHYWVASLICRNIDTDNITGAASDGYIISHFYDHLAGDNVVNTKTVFDGKARAGLDFSCLDEYDERTPSNPEEIALVSLLANESQETQYYNETTKQWEYYPAGSSKTASAAKQLSIDTWKSYWIDGFKSKKETPRLVQSHTNDFYSDKYEITNLRHANNESTMPLYFTVDQDVYVMKETSIQKLEICDSYGRESILPTSDGILNYYTHNRPNGEDVLQIVSGYIQYATKSEGGEVVDNSSTIIDIFELVRAVKGTEKFDYSGPNRTTIPGRVAFQMSGGLTYEDWKDSEPGIAIYYLANRTSKSTNDKAYGSVQLEQELCNLYVWRWVADYGAKVLNLSAPETVDIREKSFDVDVTYTNCGPKVITDAVKVEWYLTVKGQDGARHTAELPGQLRQGDTRTGTIKIDFVAETDGWIRVNAAITEVKVNGKWYTSNEAGFKPRWVHDDDLTGKLHIYAQLDQKDDAKLNIHNWDEYVALPKNLRIKVYRQHLKFEEGVPTAYEWETNPHALIELKDVQKVGQQFAWNTVYDLTKEDYWFKGFYSDEYGTVPIQDRDQTVKNVKYEEIVTAVKFELIGVNGETWNAIYDSKQLSNPMLKNLCYIETDISDQRAGYVTGGGSIWADGSKSVTLKANLNEGYVVEKWTRTDATGIEEELTSYSSATSITVTPSAGTVYEKYKVYTKPEDNRFNVSAFATYLDGETAADITGVLIDGNIQSEVKYTVLPQSNWRFFSVLKNNKQGRTLRLTASYDPCVYKFLGWYQHNSEEDGTKVATSSEDDRVDQVVSEIDGTNIGATIEFTIPESGTAFNQYVYEAKFEREENPLVTFNANGGVFSGLQRVPTEVIDGKKALSQAKLDQAKVTRYGYKFIEWRRANGDPVKAGVTEFTEDEIVYAHYEKLESHSVIVRSNYPERGFVELNGVSGTECSEIVPEDTTVILNYEKAASIYGIDPDNAWKVYEIWYDGKYYESKRKPEKVVLDGGTIYKFDVEDSDWLIVAQFGYASTEYFDLVLETNTDNVGASLGSVDTKNLDNEGWKINDNHYRLLQNHSQTFFTAEIDPEYKDDYVFKGWYAFDLNPDGTKIISEQPINTTEKMWTKDNIPKAMRDNLYVRLMAVWEMKPERDIKFEKSNVNVNVSFAGSDNLNKLIGDYNPANVTYSSSDTNIITVDNSGRVSAAKKSGKVTIKATVAGDEKYAETSATYTITVRKLTQSIEFENKEVNSTVYNEFTNSFAKGKEPITKDISYSSSNTQVAVVDGFGLVTCLRKGDAIITARAKADDKYYDATATFTVHVEGAKQNLRFKDTTVDIQYGADPFTNPLTGAMTQVKYSSTNTSVAKVDLYTGKVTVVGAGTAEIIANAVANDTYEAATKRFTVNVLQAPQILSFKNDIVEVSIDSSQFINPLSGAKTAVTYSSDDETVAKVDAKTGLVTLTGKRGTAAIEAVAIASGGYMKATKQYIVKVSGREQKLFFANQKVFTKIGDEIIANKLSGNKGTVTYSSSDLDVVLVNSMTGEVAARGVGTATIWADAAATDQYEKGHAEYTITIDRGTQRIRFENNTVTIGIDDSGKVNTLNGAKSKVTYTSGDTSIVEVDERSGDIGKPKKAGTVMIYAEATQSQIYEGAEAAYMLSIDPGSQEVHFQNSEVAIKADRQSGPINVLIGAEGTVTYKSSNEKIAKIDSTNGDFVSSSKAGTVMITAEVAKTDTKTATSSSYVLIVDKATQSIAFEKPDQDISIASPSFTNKATVEKDEEKIEVIYRSSNTDIVTVDQSGVVTPANKFGEAVITAVAKENEKYYSASASYKVNVRGLEQKIRFEQDLVEKTYGDDEFIIEPLDYQGNLTYYSSDPRVASVDYKTGKVSINRPGTVLIYVNAAQTDKYLSGRARYRIDVDKAQQTITFAEAEITRKLTDDSIINDLNGAKGKVTYAVVNKKVATVDANTGRVSYNAVGETRVIAKVTATDYYLATRSSYLLEVTRGEQHPAFINKKPTTTFVDATEGHIFKNELTGAKSDVTYSIIGQQQRGGFGDGSRVAEVDANTGDVTVLNAGSVTVRAVANTSDQYESASADYTLTVEPKSIGDTQIFVVSNTSQAVIIIDGKDNVLVEGRDYELKRKEDGTKVTYTITGIGNYCDTEVRNAEVKQDVTIVETFGTEVSPDIPASQYAAAQRMLDKTKISGFNHEKVPVDEIKVELISTGQITEEEFKYSNGIGIGVEVEVTLNELNPKTGEATYALLPTATVVAWKNNGEYAIGFTVLDASWLSKTKNILVTLGTVNGSSAPLKLIHRTDDGTDITTYYRGSSPTGNLFVYDETNRTVTFNIEHCSQIIIKTQEDPTPTPDPPTPTPDPPTPDPKPTPRPSGGGSSGTTSSGLVFSKYWFQNEKKEWMLRDGKGGIVKGSWACDDDVVQNGKNVWYMLDAQGILVSAGLVIDKTGNYYSLETTHNGYFGSIRYRNGYYNCNGQSIYLEFEQQHNGSFGAIKNAEAIEKLKKIYGVTKFEIDNSNSVYTATFP